MMMEARDARGARWLESVTGDVRFALRHFARTPLVTSTILFVLALGIGVNSASFSVLQAFTLRPAPAVPRDDALVRIHGLAQAWRGATWGVYAFSYPEVEELAARRETFSAVAAWTAHDVIVDRGDGNGPRDLVAEFVTPNYFTALGVALVGPGFAVDPSTPDFAAVISFWNAKEWFPDPAAAVGQRIVVNEIPVRIVGIAPPRFQGAVPNSVRPTIWLPVSARAAVARTSPRWLSETWQLSLFARLAPGATTEQATAIAQTLVARALPDSAARSGFARRADVRSLRGAPPASSLDDQLVAVAGLGVVALLILLVACTNVSSLLVAAAVARRHEIAVRLSLGASRARLLRQLLTESALLALAGGVAGLILYWWFTRIAASLTAGESVEIAPDLLTVGFTMAFALATGVLFGLSPALHATRAGVATALRDSGSGVTGRSRLQRSFVVAQIVFSLPLLVLLAMLLASTIPEGGALPDAASRHVVSARFRPLRSRTGPASRGGDNVQAIAERLAAQPEVVGVVPEPMAFTVRNVGGPNRAQRDTGVVRVHVEGTPPGYFALLGIPIVVGRDVSLMDSASAEYAIVIGSDLARRIWGTASPLGQRLTSTDWKAGARDTSAMVVVGVYDAKYSTTRGGDARVYTATGKRWRNDAILVRTRGPAQATVIWLQTFVRSATPALPVTRIETLTDIAQRERREALQVAAGAAAAGALALMLASIGLYGVVSLAVGQRRREIGIRIALGGRPLRVAGMFLASGMKLSAIALLIGLPATIVVARLALSEGIVIVPRMNMPLIGVGIGVLVLLVTTAASWLPARRAAAVDPALALRAE